MFILFRFAMILVGILYRAQNRIRKKRLVFIHDESTGLKYAYKVTKKKSVIEIEFTKRIFFKISPEKKVYNFLKIMGFNSELQTGNIEFDQNQYIESDHPAFKRGLSQNQELQNLIIKLRQLGFDKVIGVGNGRLKFMSKTYLNETLTSDLINLIKSLQIHLEKIEIFRGESDPFIKKILFFEVFYYGIGFYGISTYVAHSIDDGTYLLDPLNLMIKGAWIGGTILLAWIAISFSVLKKSSRAPVFFGEVFLGTIVCFIFGGSQMIVDLNELLDKSKPEYATGELLEKYLRTTGRGRRRSTSFYISLKFPDKNKFQIPTSLRVNGYYYHILHKDMAVEFTIHRGYFHSPYISSMRSLPRGFLAVNQIAKKTDLISLMKWSSKDQTFQEKDLVWHEEFYPNKQRRQKEPFLNGQRNGTGMYWHQNGELYAKIPWINNQKHGRFQLRREDGSIEQDLSYKEGKPHGMSTWYNKDGSIHAQAIYQDGEVIESDSSKIKSLILNFKP
jgi:hypothetical protein